ncbi:MAG: hypothetical protein IIA73_03195 [Proteobacteria bacterium]|nr:hypothetical protein [Pseudomonadota bacterium]
MTPGLDQYDRDPEIDLKTIALAFTVVAGIGQPPPDDCYAGAAGQPPPE